MDNIEYNEKVEKYFKDATDKTIPPGSNPQANLLAPDVDAIATKYWAQEYDGKYLGDYKSGKMCATYGPPASNTSEIIDETTDKISNCIRQSINAMFDRNGLTTENLSDEFVLLEVAFRALVRSAKKVNPNLSAECLCATLHGFICEFIKSGLTRFDNKKG